MKLQERMILKKLSRNSGFTLCRELAPIKANLENRAVPDFGLKGHFLWKNVTLNFITPSSNPFWSILHRNTFHKREQSPKMTLFFSWFGPASSDGITINLLYWVRFITSTSFATHTFLWGWFKLYLSH